MNLIRRTATNLHRHAGVVFLALLFALSGCSSRDQPMVDAVMAAVRRDPGYSPAGETAVRKLAESFVKYRGKDQDENQRARLARQAAESGSHDAFVRYIQFLHDIRLEKTPAQELTREGARIADETYDKGYPDFLRAYAAHQAYQTWIRVFKKPDDTTTWNHLADLAWDATFDAIKDPIVVEPMSRRLAWYLDLMWKYGPEERAKLGKNLEQEFTRYHGDCTAIHYLRGVRGIDLAWASRGGGYANTVTAEGWVGFKKELKIAKDELDLAWKMDPADPDICASRITIAMGLQEDRKEMEKWFERGLASRQDVTSVCDTKHYFLAPKWSGSFQEQLAFSREALRYTKFSSSAAALLWQTHYYHRFSEPPADKYLTRPDVWAEIKLSLSTFYADNPDSKLYRPEYAYYAWVAHDWPVFKEQLTHFEPDRVDLSEIGGREVYDLMVADAKLDSPKGPSPE